MTGYHLSTSEGIVGHVCDFMMDDQTWAIGQLVIKIGHRFSGREVLIPVGKVERISYEDSTIFVSLSKEAVEKQSEEPIASPARDASEHPKAEKTRPDIFSLYEK